jgi:hypothetical protein
MNDLLISAVVVLFGFIGLMFILSRCRADERPWVVASFFAHIVGGLALILLTIYFFGGGDMIAYHKFGVFYAEYLSVDFAYYAPEILRYALRMHTQEPQPFFMVGETTGAMMGISTWLMFVTGGSLYGGGLLISMLSFLSKFFMYRGFRLVLPRRYQLRALCAAMLLPSVVFWSSGLLKEPIAMLGMGPMIWGWAQLIQGERRRVGLAALVLGAIPIGVIKPYILFPMLLCGGGWFYWHRQMTARGQYAVIKQPLYLVLACFMSLVGIVFLGAIFPEFAVDNLADEAAGLQSIGQRVQGGSSYTITATPTRSMVGQLAIAPIGLLFALFRPLPFDVRNAAMLLNALEMLGLLWLWWSALRQRPWRQSLRLVFSSPMLVFCLAFCVMFGAMVGISSTNIGTLSRYRTPMMPLYALLLLVLAARQANPNPQTPGATR